MSLRVQYARPRNLGQAAELLGALGSGAMIIAGGQELMPYINYGKLDPSVLVDIGSLNELRGIESIDGVISIGALTVHRDIQNDPLVNESAPLLANAAVQVGGGWQVQNQGTIGGNIVSMHPLYDIVPPLLVLGAEVEMQNADGARRTTLAALIDDSSHQLGTGAVLTRVLVPEAPANAGWAYEKLKLTDGSYGSANAAAMLTLDASGKVQSIRLVLGAVTEKPLDVSDTLEKLCGRMPGADFDAAVEAACIAAVTQPLSDQQGDAEYRQAMAGVVGRRAAAAAAQHAAKTGDAHGG